MTFRIGALTSIAAAFLLYGAMPAAAQVRLEFQQGRVNLSTQNATARTILAEWARLGGTRILNAERVGGPPLTLELVGVSERQALDVILRGVSGYMIASREVAGSGASGVDRIMILPTSTAPRVGATPTPMPVPAAFSPQPVVQDDAAFDNSLADDDLDIPQAERPFPVNPRSRIARPVLPPNSTNGGPVLNGGPVQNGADSDDPTTPADRPATEPAAVPGNPFGVQPGAARPGFVPQPPPPGNRPQPEVEN